MNDNKDNSEDGHVKSNSISTFRVYNRPKNIRKVERSQSELLFKKEFTPILITNNTNHQLLNHNSTQPTRCCCPRQQLNLSKELNQLTITNCSRVPVVTSKSDGSIVATDQNLKAQTFHSSYSQNFKAAYPQECCASFGTGKQRLQSNACVIV